jgi:hypothetical protein
MTSMEEAENPDKPAVHPVDEVLPAPRLVVLGLQHLFIMYAGAVAVPLIVGPAVGLDGSDIAIQSVGIGKIMGVRLPVVLFFNHWWPNLHRRHGAVDTAVKHGAVVPNTEATTRQKADATPKHAAE